MNNRRQLNKRTHFTIRRHARARSLLTLARRAWLSLGVMAILAVPSWQAWRSHRHILTIDDQLEKLIRMEGSTLYRDELLAMSAKMAAATGDMKWASQDEASGSRIEAAVEEIRSVFKDSITDTRNAEEALSVCVDDKLDKTEAAALDLVRQGKYDRATTMLQSPEYEEQRRAYNKAMKAFIGNAERVMEDRRDRQRRVMVGSLAVSSVILSWAVLFWLYVRQKRRRIRERAAIKQKLNSFAQKWHETFNAITDGVCIIDKSDGKIVQCNVAMTRFLGRPYKEIIGKSCCELLHNSSQPVKRCPLVRMYESRRSETKDFEIGDKWLNIKVDPLINDDGELVGAVHILSDITKQRKATRALQNSENRFRLAFANAQDAIVWIDIESGVITNCNKAAEELLERPANQIVGRHHTSLYPAGNDASARALPGESGADFQRTVETQIRTGSGEIRTVTIAVSTMQVDGKRIAQGIIRDITESKRAIEEIKNLAKFLSEDPNPVLRISKDCKIIYANDASSPLLERWQIQEGQPLPEPWDKRVEGAYHSGSSATYELDCEDGRTFYITLQPIVEAGYVNAYGLDITKRKKAEKEKMALELQLSEKQKLDALGTLAGGIAHDFNNILGAMRGYLELSLDDLSEDHPVREYLDQILSCIDRAAKLVKQILTFSRKDQQDKEKEPVRLGSMVKEVLGMLRSSLPATIKISRKIHAGASMVLADSTQIHQVLLNLCTNASHAMRDNGGLLEVSLEDVDLTSETKVGDEHLRPGSYVKLGVKDSGCGMPKEVMERIFEPFFTTKKVNEGTGLGLSVVHGIIKSHDGAITVSSAPGEGTTFDIFLPKIESGNVESPESRQGAPKDNELIFLVGDDEMVINSMNKILERLGFDVMTKMSSIEALESFQEEPDKFDLVITEQTMPNMTGTQLSEKLLSIRPDISVILCSVFPEDVSPEEIRRIGIREFVTQPITMQKINRVIRKVLDKSSVTA